jgi:choline-sulfatase
MSVIRRCGSVVGQPNILIIMVEQLNGTLFDHGPKLFLNAPHLKNQTVNSVCFPTCYTASPLFTPWQASFMSGKLSSRTRVYDNAAEFFCTSAVFGVF